MYKAVVKPLIKEAKSNQKKAENLQQELKTTRKHLKTLNACIRHPFVIENLQRSCKRRLQKYSKRHIDKLIVQKLRNAGLYGNLVNIDKFAKVLNEYLIKPMNNPQIMVTETESLERTLSDENIQEY